MNTIRNFVIIAHIDSGKSTLADRLLEVTNTVERRTMRPQYLDQLSLERERGITIKMAPVRMEYTAKDRGQYVLNLIDTPGHSDFSYEVSRALAAVEGAVLLVDGTKGIQAQTLANFRGAREMGLTIVGAVNKIDMAPPNLEETVALLAELIHTTPDKILRISARTGAGVEELLERIVTDVPAPTAEKNHDGKTRGLIFDSVYDDHKGIVAYVRVMNGKFLPGKQYRTLAASKSFVAKEAGHFRPRLTPAKELQEGEIGYIATGLKEPAAVQIGDTMVFADEHLTPLKGYRTPAPVVFISFYPQGGTSHDLLRQSLERLRLNDAALTFEPESNDVLGRGFKVGCLGQLHFEIVASRLRDEYNLDFSTSLPSVAYRIREKGEERPITQPTDFPEKPEEVYQPMIAIEIVTPPHYLHTVLGITTMFDLTIKETLNFGHDLRLMGKMPLAELMRGFDNALKSASAGYASFSYELAEYTPAEVEKMEVLVNDESVAALTRIVPKHEVEREGRRMVERLRDLLPKEQFKQILQAKAHGRIIARETIPAIKKKLGDFGKNGGDITRKMKLWRKQERGKEKLQAMAKVSIGPEVIREVLKKDA